MLYAIGSALPEYRVKAFRSGGDACNLICDDTHARRHGYKAGLVSGVSIYAYMSRSVVEFLGQDWLERGFAEVAFHHPTYEGEEIRVTGQLSSVTKEGTLCIDLKAENAQGMACGTGVARLPAHRPQPEPTIDDCPAGQHALRRPISLHSLKVGEHLTRITSEFDRKTHWEYCEKSVRDHHPIYRQFVHPGWFLAQANSILTANYDLPPWIHVSSAVQNYRAQENECVVETRGRVVEKFELRGNHFIVLDVTIFGGQNCLATVRHTAIFRIAPRVA
jgi:acyl dehydratase